MRRSTKSKMGNSSLDGLCCDLYPFRDLGPMNAYHDSHHANKISFHWWICTGFGLLTIPFSTRVLQKTQVDNKPLTLGPEPKFGQCQFPQILKSMRVNPPPETKVFQHLVFEPDLIVPLKTWPLTQISPSLNGFFLDNSSCNSLTKHNIHRLQRCLNMSQCNDHFGFEKKTTFFFPIANNKIEQASYRLKHDRKSLILSDWNLDIWTKMLHVGNIYL